MMLASATLDRPDFEVASGPDWSPRMVVYRENPKHKRGTSGEGPPRWFPSRDSLCPDGITMKMAQELLDSSIEGRDDAHPDARARFALDGSGAFFKAYSEDGGETWHGYPVNRELVPRQIPTRVLRAFRARGQLTRAQYNDLVGPAR